MYAVWHRAIEIAIERDVDAVIHAGDLFDSARPSPRALSEALDGIVRLRDAGIPMVAIAGNHSTPRFRSGGSVFEILQRFGVNAAWQEPQTFRIGEVAFHAVPHEADGEQLQDDIRALAPDAVGGRERVDAACRARRCPSLRIWRGQPDIGELGAPRRGAF